MPACPPTSTPKPVMPPSTPARTAARGMYHEVLHQVRRVRQVQDLRQHHLTKTRRPERDLAKNPSRLAESFLDQITNKNTAARHRSGQKPNQPRLDGPKFPRREIIDVCHPGWHPPGQPPRRHPPGRKPAVSTRTPTRQDTSPGCHTTHHPARKSTGSGQPAKP